MCDRRLTTHDEETGRGLTLGGARHISVADYAPAYTEHVKGEKLMATSARMLEGVRIVAFTQFLLGPAGAQYLADMGADVIKVEPQSPGPYERRWSGGDSWPGGVSAFYLLAHRNVRSVTLNLKDAEGQAIARRLATEAHVVVENFRPGVMKRFGLGYEDLSEDNPGLIYATASGYGTDNPQHDLPGQDLLLQAMTGLAAATGQEDNPPTAAGAAIVDQHAAALLAMGILGGLYQRQRTGQGQWLEITMVQAAFDLQSEPLVYHLNGGTVRRPQEPLASGFHEAPYGFYATTDGHIALSLSPIRLIAKALDNPPQLEPFVDPSVALAKREEIHRAISSLLRTRTTTNVLKLFREHGIWCAPVNDYDAALADPVVRQVDPILEISHPDAGNVKVLKHPVRYGGEEPGVRRQPPRLGEHTDEVLREQGYETGEIQRLHLNAVV